MANEIRGKISLDISSFLSALQSAAQKVAEFATASTKAIPLVVKADTAAATSALKEYRETAEKPIELPPIEPPDIPDTFNFGESLKKAKDEAAKLQTELASVIAQGGKGSALYDSIAVKLKEATSEADRLEAAMKEAGDASKTVKLTPSDAFTNSLKSAKDQATQLQNEVAQIAVTQGKGSTAYADAVKRLKEATSEADRLEEALSDAAEQTKKIEPPKGLFAGLTDQFKSAKEQATSGGGIFGGIASQIGQMVSPIGAATAAIGILTAGLGASFSVGMEFETNLKSVQAVTGVAGAALEDIGDRAKNLAATFGGNASQQLGVFQTTLSKIGPQLAQDSGALSTFAENVNVLGKTDSALGAAGAVDALTGAMLQFGVDVNNSNEVARESTRFINVLAASAAVGSASVSDVAAAVAVVGGTAKNANITFEETNAALQVLAAKSISAGPAGTALTAVINKLQAASGPAADQLIAMGTSSQELGQILTTKGIGAAMDKLRGSMDSLGGTAEKNAFLVGLFGETGLGAANALLGGGEMLKDFTEGVTGTQSAFEQATVNMSTLSERINQGMAGLSNIGVSIYQALLPVISEAINFIISKVVAVKDALAPAFAAILSPVGLIAKGIALAFGGAVYVAITALSAVLVAFGKGLQILSPAIIAVGAAWGVYAIATNLGAIATAFATVQTWLLNAAWAANPIGAAVAVIILAVAALGALADALIVTNKEQLENAEAQKKSVEQQIKQNEEQKKAVKGTQDLVKEYKELAAKSKLTAEEQSRLKNIQAELDKQYPDLIDQTKSFGENLKGVEEIGKKTASSMEKLTKQGTELAKQLAESVKMVAISKRSVAIEELQDLVGIFTGGIGPNATKFRYEYGLLRREFEKGIYTAKTIGDIDAVQLKMTEAFNNLAKVYGPNDALSGKGLDVIDAKQIADIIGATQKVVDSGKAAIESYNASAKKAGEEAAKALGGGIVDGFKKWQDQLKKLKEAVAVGTKEEDDAAVAGYIKRLEGAQALKEITEKQQEDLRNQAKALTEQEKKDGKDKNKELLDELKKRYEQEKVSNDLALQGFEDKLNQQVELDKRSKMNEEELRALAEKKLEISEKNLSIYERIFKLSKDAEGQPVVAIPALEEAGKNTVKKEYFAFLKDLSNQRIQLNKVEFDSEGLKAQLDDIISSIDITKGIKFEAEELDLYSAPIEIDAAFSIKTGEALSKSELFFLEAENKVKALNDFILRSEEQLQQSKDDVEKKALKTQIDRAKEEIKKSEKAISDERIKVKTAEQERMLALLDDEDEREFLQKKEAIRKEFEEVVTKTRAEGAERLQLQALYLEKEATLTEEYRKKNARGFGVAMSNAAEAASLSIADAFAKPYSFQADAEQAEEAKKQIESLREEQNKLFKQLQDGELSFEDYQAKFAELGGQIAELEKVSSSIDWQKIWGEFTSRAAEAFTALGETLRKSFDDTVEQRTKYEKQVSALSARLHEIQDESSAEYKKILEEKKGIEKKASEATNTVYGVMTASVLTNTAKMVAEGKPLFEALGAAAFDALQMMVPIWSAQILGGSLATPQSIISGGGWGLANWALMTGLISAAVAAARAALGFREGGYTGDGKRDAVAGVVHAGEVVFEQPLVQGQKSSLLAIRTLLQSGVSAAELLDSYQYQNGSYKQSVSTAIHTVLASDTTRNEYTEAVTVFKNIIRNTNTIPYNDYKSRDIQELRQAVIGISKDIQDFKKTMTDDLNNLGTTIRRQVALQVGVTVDDKRSKVDLQREAIRNQIRGGNNICL